MAGKDTPSGGSTVRNALEMNLPVQASHCKQALSLIAAEHVRFEEVTRQCLEDPVILIELLKTGNSLVLGARNIITSIKTIIVRLGVDSAHKILDDLNARPPLTGDAVIRWFEQYRKRCSMTGHVARRMAEQLASSMAEDCFLTGSFSYIGDMLVIASFKEQYTALADAQPRTTVNYRLAQNHHFDVEDVGLRFLRKQGVPDIVLFPLERENQKQYKDRTMLRPLCLSAVELVEAYTTARWEKYIPGQALPQRSDLRLLQINDAQYTAMFEAVREYLASVLGKPGI